MIPQKNVSLSTCTTFQLGGNCPEFYDCQTADQLESAMAKVSGNFLVIGEGSNLLIADKGLPYPVIRYLSATPAVEISGTSVRVSGATLLRDFAAAMVDAGLAGATFATGIPGTVGGGVAGNAGAFGEQLGDILTEAELLFPSGEKRIVSPSAVEFSYRDSWLKHHDAILLWATFDLSAGDFNALKTHQTEIMKFRHERHPYWIDEPCAGSFFRNIEASSAAERRQAAGFFLEQAGAHEFTENQAYIFEKHANMIIAGAGAKSSDVKKLAARMQRAVLEKFGIELIPEVRFLGF